MESGQTAEQGKAGEGKLLTLGDLLKFFFRRRLTILAVVALFFLLGMAYCVFATRRFQAEGLIEVKQPEDSLGLNSLVQGTAQSSAVANPLEETVTLSTKVQELQSDSLGLRVIDELQMERTPDFRPHFSLSDLNFLPKLLSAFAPPIKRDAPGTPFLQSPARRAKALSVFESHLKVEVVPGTRLISIAYSNPDAELSAAVVKALANDLAQSSFQARYESTQQLSAWLGDQIESVRRTAEDMQQQESQLRRETETYNLGGTNAAGQTMVYSPLLDHLQQTTLALSQAESNRILRSAVSQIVQTKDPKLISGLAGSGLIGSGNPQSATSLDLINQLQQKESDQEVLISHDALRYGDANPKLIQEKAQLEAIQVSLKAETDRLAQRAKNDYTIATAEEERTRQEHDKLIKRANVVNDKALQYEIVRQDAQDARQLYTDLNRRLRESGVVAGLRAADTTMVSPALAPDKPSSPRIPIVLLASLVGGFLVGIVLAGIQDVRDDKVNTVDSVETELGIPVYAVTPDFNVSGSLYGYGKGLYQKYGGRRRTETEAEKQALEAMKKHPIMVIADPDSQYSEAIRVLRTAILLSRPGATPKTILITSSTPAEGKSTTSVNLAATYARTGARTLLVEIDLRKPVIAKRIGLPPSLDGLSRMLTGQLPKGWVTTLPDVPNLFCIPAGQRPPDPHELISSESMKTLIQYWQGQYDLVILDGPPVLPVIDSVLISEQADLVLVITRFGRTSINSLRTTHRLLSRQVRANIGAVLNAVSQGTEGYYAYYGYKNNTYKYEGVEE